MIIGGSGTERWDVVLPEHIEHLYPDYELYDCNYAIGFTSRGCCRKCSFCIVPKKEGNIKPVADIYEFWNGQERLMLLDNNLTALPNHFELIIKQLIKECIKVDFSQGFDIRILNEDQVQLLKKVKLWKRIHFAWDNITDEKRVIEGIKLLTKYKMNWQSTFYVLIGFDTTPEEDIYRIKKLKELKVESFVMPYNKTNQYQKDFTRWVNRKAIFKSVPWKNYHPKREGA